MYTLAHPMFLILLPIPLIFRALVPGAKMVPAAGLKIPFYHHAVQWAELKSTAAFYNSSMWYAMILIWVLLVFSVADPQWLGAPQLVSQDGRDIMLALDISGSMQMPDMNLNGNQVDRLTVVKETAQQFITNREQDRFGLILFASKAYLQTPFTFDHITVNQMLADATIGLAGTQTAIGDALGAAIKEFSKTPAKSRLLILLTDGSNNSGNIIPLDAAQMALKAGIKIYTIGLGATQMIIPGIFGSQVINPTNDLDETLLKEIAKTTGGKFFRAENTADLNQVYQAINQLEPVQTENNFFRPIKHLYPWPLALAGLLALIILLRRMR